MFSDYVIHLAVIYGSIALAIAAVGLLLYFAFGVCDIPEGGEIVDDKLKVHGVDALAWEHIKAVARLYNRGLTSRTVAARQLYNVSREYDISEAKVQILYDKATTEVKGGKTRH